MKINFKTESEKYLTNFTILSKKEKNSKIRKIKIKHNNILF